jgi:sentrin-specific protease 8
MAKYLDTDDLTESLKGLTLPERQLVFIPVNNNEDPTAQQAGSHWSMLVWIKTQARFCHFDSSAGCNKRAAEATARALQSVVRPGATSSSTIISHESTPQQTNGYDCGVYAMAIAATVANNGGTTDLSVVTPGAVQAWRVRVRSMVLEMHSLQRVEQALKAITSGTG